MNPLFEASVCFCAVGPLTLRAAAILGGVMRKWNLGLAFFILSLCIFQRIASASEPDGAPPQNATEAFAKADAVFLGKVESVTNDRFGYPSLANVRVEKFWKGGISGNLN